MIEEGRRDSTDDIPSEQSGFENVLRAHLVHMVVEPSPKFAPTTRNDDIHHPTTSTSLEPLSTTSPNASNRLLQHRDPYDLPDHL